MLLPFKGPSPFMIPGKTVGLLSLFS